MRLGVAYVIPGFFRSGFSCFESEGVLSVGMRIECGAFCPCVEEGYLSGIGSVGGGAVYCL